jgi:hypothetical protein
MTAPPASRKEEAIAQILQIIAASDLDAADLSTIVASARTGAPPRVAPAARRRVALGRIVLRVFYYLGGTLVLAGLGIYIETVWQDLTSVQRVLVTLGPGVIAYVLGILFARHPDLEKAATPAHILAFLLQPIGGFVLLEEFAQGGDWSLGAMVVFGPLAVQQLLTFAALKRGSLLLFGLLFVYAFAGALTAYYDVDFGLAAVSCGLFLYFMSVDLRQRSAYRELTPLFFLLGSGLMLAGVSYHVEGTIYEPLKLALSLAFLAHAVVAENRTLYVAALMSVAAYVLAGPGGSWWGWTVDQRRYHEIAAMFDGSTLVLAGHWLSRASFISASPIWMFVGTGFALGGAYSFLWDSAAAPLFVGVATLVIYGALWLRSRAMLAAAILGLLGFITAYGQKHFANSVGWPLLLVAFGFVVLLAGVAFARLSGKIREPLEQRT